MSIETEVTNTEKKRAGADVILAAGSYEVSQTKSRDAKTYSKQEILERANQLRNPDIRFNQPIVP